MMESRETDAPLAPDPPSSGAPHAPEGHRRPHRFAFPYQCSQALAELGVVDCPKPVQPVYSTHCKRDIAEQVLLQLCMAAWGHRGTQCSGLGCSQLPSRSASPGSVVAGL